MNSLPKILAELQENAAGANDALLPLVYEELRELAAAKLRQERPGQTLQPTALVHEAYLRLAGAPIPPKWENQRHFLAAAAEAMRRILIDRARQKAGPRRGGGLKRVDADLDLEHFAEQADDLLDLNDALSRLEEESPPRAQLVKLRFFAGLTIPEAAEVMGISVATAERYWAFARNWLYSRLG